MTHNQTHHTYLKRCLELAKKGKGNVEPNPMVGAVLVHKKKILGQGYHTKYGAPHAEVEAIQDAIGKGHAPLLSQAILYVNLEPCSHHGKTPPCTDIIIQNKIPHVIVGMRDPNPKVAGTGIQTLIDTGILVDLIQLPEAKTLNKVFIKNITTGLPYIHLKVALTQDNKLTKKPGTQTKITSTTQDIKIHRLRAQYDGILVGSNTIEIDNPRLTCRLAQLTKTRESGTNPVRIILSSQGELLSKENVEKLNIFKETGTTIIATTKKREKSYKETIHTNQKCIVKTYACRATPQGQVDINHLLSQLYKTGIHSILIEGGKQIIHSFNKGNHIDEFSVFKPFSEEIHGRKLDNEGMSAVISSLIR